MMNVKMVETQKPTGDTVYTFSFDHVLSLNERRQVEDYLKATWCSDADSVVELDADFLDNAIRQIQVSRLQRLHETISERVGK